MTTTDVQMKYVLDEHGESLWIFYNQEYIIDVFNQPDLKEVFLAGMRYAQGTSPESIV